ncbi:hypothetical protein DFH29DRAFT_878009 [Suillus ampliporus]|nr:hypothetical protein DFH29DRAFT_878009 [Suillus ampliporus]
MHLQVNRNAGLIWARAVPDLANKIPLEYYGLSAAGAAGDAVREDDVIRKRSIIPYSCQDQLMVKMPSDTHEAVLVPLISAFTRVFDQMSHNNTVVQVHTNGNTHFAGSHVPDVHIQVTSTLSHTSSEPKSIRLTEVTYAQSEAAAIQKIHKYTLDAEDMESVSCIKVSETTVYACPSRTSDIAIQLRSLGHLKLYDEWTPMQTMKNAFGPVILDGHIWIDVSMVDMHVWTHTSLDTPINVYWWANQIMSVAEEQPTQDWLPMGRVYVNKCKQYLIK